ncbi:MAG: AAA family ATPase [Prevotella sp.]|nr:AAA family ATPase [Prevotella sp.]MDD7273465.1 AAA family ATPase [Prevotellaceae bacterium]MDY3935158.1 AAA family ATPase [Prevotella sp.]MDY4218500.1 AAA family ATPase [Prevotella sp.]
MGKKQALDLNNEEFQKALQIVQFTRNSLFLTGRAGTGKSTFLRYISENVKKKHVILAPTGIAAINAGGATLHSFFKIPLHPLLPNDTRYSPRKIRETLKYNSEKIKLLKELELIIIDEISMVRADIVDFIDRVLRIYNRNMREPFGGKQLLLVGDVYQLEPVLKEDDRQLLSPYYPSGFFFHAKVFQGYNLVSIELKKVYRQHDPTFISILDHIRTNNILDTELERINQQVNAVAQSPTDQSLSITLSTRRDTVDYINQQELEKLAGEVVTFHGTLKGDFPENTLPTPIELTIKVGAHVMFIKNDAEHQWVNGTLGIVSGIDELEGLIYVRNEEGKELQVGQDFWENIVYTFNTEEQRIEEKVIGSYVQFPLKLAWAITIHKSQGLTFKNVNIDFGSGVFAAGQTYVALSRCTHLEGIRLQKPIRRKDIFVKPEVVGFARRYNDGNRIKEALSQSKADKEYHDAITAFDKGDFDGFLANFFLAIHSRYDIEKPGVKRFIRRKLNVINQLKAEVKTLKEEMESKQDFLKKLSTEYVLMGKECEREGMKTAAINNYKKALELYPDNPIAKERLARVK